MIFNNLVGSALLASKAMDILRCALSVSYAKHEKKSINLAYCPAVSSTKKAGSPTSRSITKYGMRKLPPKTMIVIILIVVIFVISIHKHHL